jgi:hypothetical protein
MDTLADATEKSERIRVLRGEFEKGINFHAESFREIDAKAKYWLTLMLPSLIALMTYAFQQGPRLSIYLIAVFSSISVCLVLATYFFAKTLGALRVESGILSPGDHGFDSAKYYLESNERWAELEEDQAKEACRAFVENDRQNSRKSQRLRSGENLLFRGLPAAACLAVGATFLDATAGPGWFAPSARASTGVTAGIAVGACVCAFLVAFDHFFALKSGSRSP